LDLYDRPLNDGLFLQEKALNYLSHLFFSDDTEDALLGSLLGDFVKGSTAGRFSAAISDAILLHRKIDSFSDAHRITRESRNRISPSRRRFAGIIVDVCYDHFLSRHWGDFSRIDPANFVERVYAVLMKNSAFLPDRLSRVLPRMISENWLGSYVHLKGVGEALDRIAGRLSRGDAFRGSIIEIESNYRALEGDFLSFFPELAAFCKGCNRYGELRTGKPQPGWGAGEFSEAGAGRAGAQSGRTGCVPKP
jgi:acyl carrier protein phosphodiesterase